MHITTIHVLEYSEKKVQKKKLDTKMSTVIACLTNTHREPYRWGILAASEKNNNVLELDFIFPFVSLSFSFLPLQMSDTQTFTHWR